MAGSLAVSSQDGRPKALHPSRSFTRMAPSTPDPLSPRKRASTIAVSGIPAIPEARPIDTSPDLRGDRSHSDVFEDGHVDEEHEASEPEMSTPALNLPSTLDELPIEIRSMTERFLESLSAKVHPAPLSAEALSEMFQDFYERAASQISTHIAILTSRIGRRGKAGDTGTTRVGKGRARDGSGAKRGDSPASVSGGEMLTASEVAYRKKARRVLELKRVTLEEAVERNVCEKMYDRIWKHRSTEDDARDGKLRSRTAALSLVGIGLKELHMDQDPNMQIVRQTAEENEGQIFESLAPAREALQRMDDEHHPLGKLQHLTAAHKSIVETLSQVFPASSSADEILPTLIYTLITTPPEGLNVISNLNFIQRFRASSKVDGEAAYCLVNLEASISFLETVDLSSLRPDELPEGPTKSSSRPTTPSVDKGLSLSPVQTLKFETSPISTLSTDQSTPNTSDKQVPTPTTPTRPSPPTRKLSNLLQPHADRFESSRDNFLTAADKVYDSINNTLDTSLKTLFGRFKDQVPDNSPLPKTLEEARKLVSSPATPIEDDDPTLLPSGQSSPSLPEDPLRPPSRTQSQDKMLDLISGRKALRDQSVDSTRSGTSSNSARKVGFAEAKPPHPPTPAAKDEPLAAAANFMNSINPLNRFGVPSFPRFGGGNRASSNPSTPILPTATSEKSKQLVEIVESPTTPDKATRGEVGTEDDLNAREALEELRRIKPPKKRFLDVGSAGELRIGEVEELLKEYRRLAKAIGEAIAM